MSDGMSALILGTPFVLPSAAQGDCQLSRNSRAAIRDAQENGWSKIVVAHTCLELLGKWGCAHDDLPEEDRAGGAVVDIVVDLEHRGKILHVPQLPEGRVRN